MLWFQPPSGLDLEENQGFCKALFKSLDFDFQPSILTCFVKGLKLK
jgi:hypothetical protein